MAIRTIKKTITRGDTNEIQFEALDSAGNAIPLTGANIWLFIKETYADSDADALVTKTETDGITVDNATAGIGTATIQPADTASLPSYAHYLVYDIQVRTPAGKVTTTQGGPLWVVPDAARTF